MKKKTNINDLSGDFNLNCDNLYNLVITIDNKVLMPKIVYTQTNLKEILTKILTKILIKRSDA